MRVSFLVMEKPIDGAADAAEEEEGNAWNAMGGFHKENGSEYHVEMGRMRCLPLALGSMLI